MRKLIATLLLITAALLLTAYLFSKPGKAYAVGIGGDELIRKADEKTWTLRVDVTDPESGRQWTQFWRLPPEGSRSIYLALNRGSARRLLGCSLPYGWKNIRLDLPRGQDVHGEALGFTYQVEWKKPSVSPAGQRGDHDPAKPGTT